MTTGIRRQLTLFVPPDDAEAIEQIRQAFNPRQFEIIKAHVTLCREDEISNLEKVMSNLHLLTQPDLVIEFGNVTRFDHGKGLLFPATEHNSGFEELRRQVLAGLSDNPGKQKPHITLMHPRNSTCTDDIFRQVEKIALLARLKFKNISLIEQENGGQWKVLKDFELKNSA